MLSLPQASKRALATAAFFAALSCGEGPTEPKVSTPGAPVTAKLSLTPAEGTVPYTMQVHGAVGGDSIKAASLTLPNGKSITLPAAPGTKDTSITWSTLDSGYAKLRVTNMRDSSAADSVFIHASDASPVARLTLADSLVDMGDSLLVTLDGKDNLPNIKLKTTQPFKTDSVSIADSIGTFRTYLKPTSAQSGWVKGTVADANGHETSDSLRFRSRFAAPTLQVSTPSSDTIPHNASFAVSAKDKFSTDSLYVQYGDGVTAAFDLHAAKDTAFTLQHTYSAVGSASARFTLVNKGKIADVKTISVTSTLGNTPPPTIDLALTGRQDTIPHVVNASAHITNRDRLDSLLFRWGDGASTLIAPLTGIDTSIVRTHTYTAVGKHPLAVTVYSAGLSAVAQDTVETKSYPPANVSISLLSIDAVVNEGAQASATYRAVSDRQLEKALIYVNDVLVDSVNISGRTADFTVKQSFNAKTTNTIGAQARDTSKALSAQVNGTTYVDGKPIVSLSTPATVGYPDSLIATVSLQDEDTPNCVASSTGNTYPVVGNIARIPTINPTSSAIIDFTVVCTDSRGQQGSASTHGTVQHTAPFTINVVRADNSTPYDTTVTLDGKVYRTLNGVINGYTQPAVHTVLVPGIPRTAAWRDEQRLAETSFGSSGAQVGFLTDSTVTQLRVLPSAIDDVVDMLLLTSMGGGVKNGGFPAGTVGIAIDSVEFASSSAPSPAMRDTLARVLSVIDDDLQSYSPTKVRGVIGAPSPLITLKLRKNIIFPFVETNGVPPCNNSYGACSIITSAGIYTDNTFTIPTQRRIAVVTGFALYSRGLAADQGQDPAHLDELLTPQGVPTELYKRIIGIQGTFSKGFIFKP